MADSSSSSVSMDSINSLIGATNTSRVSGLASGIDVDNIVAKLMTAASQPLVQMQQNLQLTEWQRDDYRSMNTLLNALQTNTSTMKLQGTYLKKTVTSSDSSVVTAIAGATAGNASYRLSNINVATSSYVNSDSTIGNSSFDPSKSLWTMKSNFLDKNGNSISLPWKQNTVSQEKIIASTEGQSFQLQHTGIDSSSVTPSISLDGGATNLTPVYEASQLTDDSKVFINQETGQMTFYQPLAKGTTITSSYQYDSLDFTIKTVGQDGNVNKKDFTFSSTDSLNSILSTLSQSSVGINAFYDSTNKMVSMTRTDTGNMTYEATGNAFDFSGVSSSFLTDMLQLDTQKIGSDASYQLNDLPSSTSHSNTIVFGGVTATIQGKGTGTVTLNVNNDTDTAFQSITDFVDKYNDTIKQINDKLSEQKNRSYAPLTDAQKSSMSDSDITNWTEKAKSGMISNDSLLSSALSQLRMNLYSPVGGASNSKMDQLAEIGITTSTDYLDKGKLVIDEDKLKQALSTNPQAVMELFTKTGDTTSEQGIMQRLNTTLKNTMDKIEEKAGNTSMSYTQYSLGKSIDDMNDRIDAFKLRLQDIQTRYYTQFDAMEAAIEQANSQASYLSQFTSS
ncbi:MAG: hypothetical protein K0R18_1488 [Bacillales bacterium]|jgi:flagellar hook-associated protein 2|nr:hypothetical protein [Bacillales bacterium]MDF2789368.1 hypothetical protein [Neobacillus sp.]